MKEHKSIRIEKELIDKIQIRAIKENRSFNNTLETVIVESFNNDVIVDFERGKYPVVIKGGVVVFDGNNL